MIATCRFHNEHVGLHVFKPRCAQNRLIVETNIAGVEQRLLFSPDQNARRTKRVAGVKKFQGWRRQSRPHFMKRCPFDFAIVFETLKLRRDIVHFVVRVKRIVANAQLVPLPRHHVHGIMQHALDDKVAQLRHQHVRLGKMTTRHRQRANVIVMTMRNCNGVHLRVSGLVQHWQAGAALAFRVHSGIEQNAMLIHLHKPPARADVSIGIQIGDPHKEICGRRSKTSRL